jgi:hypothetical protein
LLLLCGQQGHCSSLLERLPSLTSNLAVLRDGRLMLAAALAATDVLGCVHELNKLAREEKREEKPKEQQQIEFPLVRLTTGSLDTLGTELAALVCPKFAPLFGQIQDPALRALSLVRDAEMLKNLLHRGNLENAIDAALWNKMVLIGDVNAKRTGL